MLLLLVHLEGLTIRVVKEDEALAGCGVGPDVLVGDSESVQLLYLANDVIDLEGQMAQACRLGVGQSLRRRVEREQLDDIVSVEGQLGQVGLLLLAPIFCNDLATDHAGIEIKGPLVVRADDGNVVYFVQV